MLSTAWAVIGVGLVESVTVTVIEEVPSASGLPLIVPDVDMERPGGNPVADQVYGVVPPLAATVVL